MVRRSGGPKSRKARCGVMKKVTVVLIAACLLALSGCSSTGSDPAGAGGESLDVEKGLLDVTITLPASMVDPEYIDATIAEARDKGIGEAVLNENGSLTYRMSRSVHGRLMKEMREEFDETIEDMKGGGDYPSIRDVRCNKNLTSITMLVEREAFENSFDAFAVFGLGISAMFYQLFDGVQSDNLSVTIDVADFETGEVFNTVVYPDDLDNPY